jgi:hypothetical protein
LKSPQTRHKQKQIQLTFLLYFPYHFTIQFTFLPHFPYLFTIQFTFPPYFPYLFTFQLAFLPAAAAAALKSPQTRHKQKQSETQYEKPHINIIYDKAATGQQISD